MKKEYTVMLMASWMTPRSLQTLDTLEKAIAIPQIQKDETCRSTLQSDRECQGSQG